MRKVLATMDACGHIRVFDMTDEDKARRMLEKIFREQQDSTEASTLQRSGFPVWGKDVQTAIRDLNWGDLEFFLEEFCGFPKHGRELFVDLEDDIDLESLL